MVLSLRLAKTRLREELCLAKTLHLSCPHTKLTSNSIAPGSRRLAFQLATRYTLNGGLMVLKAESMTMVATDGHRLAHIEKSDAEEQR